MKHQTVSQTRRTTGTARPQPPAGLRPPAPPWAKLAAWLILLICLGLLAAQVPLLNWADQQPVIEITHRNATANAPQGIERITALAALAVRSILEPPGRVVVDALALLGLSIIALELSLAAVVLIIQTSVMRRQGTLTLRIRLPQRTTARETTSGADLFRALHHQLPVSSSWSGQSPWFTLTLSARPDEPAELGLVIAGGSARQRDGWAAAIRKSIQGLAPDAVVERVADPLASALTAGRMMTWAEWRPSLPASYPIRLHNDHEASDLLGPLLAALQPRPGVVATELHLSLRPRPVDSHLARGWRAAGMRRLLRLRGNQEYALSPDARALETKLGGPVYDATLRAVAVAADADQMAQARAELDELHAVLGQYAARSASRLQRWVRSGTGQTRVPHDGGRTHRTLRHAMAIGLGSGVGLATVFVPPPSIVAIESALATGLAVTSMVSRLSGQAARRQVRHTTVRPLRATPLPGLLWGNAWCGPAVLGAEELAGIWHLPTAAQGRLVRWLPCTYLAPPPHAFATEAPITGDDGVTRPARLIIGVGRHRDDSEAPVGMPLRDARQGLAFTAPPGVGKTQLASNLADQLRPCGYTLIDGKGDDAGNLVETMRRRIPLNDEDRLVILDVLDAAWPIGLNPLAGVDLHDTGAVDQVLGQVEAIFARLDPETWSKAPRMKNYLRKATLLVLAGEPHPTIAHVKQALLDARYRERLLPHCHNVEVRDFWTVEFPQIGEQQKASRDALVSRFDMLLDSELTRYLFNQTSPAFAFQDAIAERLLVLAPLPHRTLGGLAGPVGMLLFQSLMRAAFRRLGSDLTRPEYGFIGDEFQVLVENCDTKDVRDALTQVRAFGIITIIANQLHRQLGDLADYALTAISNRILLRTQEPDATLYARHYADSGISAADIAGQEPRDHQYAWIGVHGRLTRLFSMRPLPWLPPLEVNVAPEPDHAWQQQIPSDSATPRFDRMICTLMYQRHANEEAIAQALAAGDSAHWQLLLSRWDAIRRHQRAHILAHPGCIPATSERQVWLSRLRAARPRVLAMAEYARIRQAVSTDGAMLTDQRTRPAPAQSSAAVPTNSEPRATQQPHFAELDTRRPGRLQRVEPDDLTLEPARTGEDG